MLESLTYHACLVAAGAKAHWQLLSLSSAKALDRIKQVHFQGFPSAYLAKHHPHTSPPFWTAGMPGCLYSDKLPAALLKGQAPLFSAPCNCSNLFPWVSFHSIYHQLSFPPKCFYTSPPWSEFSNLPTEAFLPKSHICGLDPGCMRWVIKIWGVQIRPKCYESPTSLTHTRCSPPPGLAPTMALAGCALGQWLSFWMKGYPSCLLSPLRECPTEAGSQAEDRLQNLA